MNTAKTLQLLDANNNNISPATCVDSLYFEKVQNGVTYRMALQNRIIVAGDELSTTSTIPDNPASLEQITIPYFYVSPASGTGNLYQLKTTTLKIGRAISNAFLNSSSNYITRTYGGQTYLKLDGTNYMTGTLNVGPTTLRSTITNSSLSLNNELVILGANSTKNEISLKTKNSSKLVLNSYKIYIGTDDDYTTQYIYIGEKNIPVNIKAKTLDISSNQNINILSGQNASIGSLYNTDIYSQDGSINIYTKNDKGSINIDSNVISLYNVTLDNPSELDSTNSNKYMLYYDTDEPTKMQWTNMPTLKLSNFGGDQISYMEDTTVDTSISFKRMCFTGYIPTYHDIMMSDEKDTSAVYIRSFTDLTGNMAKLCGDSKTDVISFCTINNKSIFFDTYSGYQAPNYEFLEKNDVSAYNKVNIKQATESENEKYFIFGDYQNDINTRKTTGEVIDTSINLNYISSFYYKTTGAVYANAFYSTSDERLKTDIQDVNIEESQIPQIKKFAWKDTSTYTYGFIAQELEKQGHSELVDTDEKGYKKVNYDAALSLAVASLQKENAELKERMKRLEMLINEKFEK